MMLGALPQKLISNTAPAITDPAVIGADFIVPDSADVLCLTESNPGPIFKLLILDGNGLPTNINQLRIIPAQYLYSDLTSYTNETFGYMVGLNDSKEKYLNSFNTPTHSPGPHTPDYSLDLGDIDTGNIEIITANIPDVDYSRYSIQKLDASNNLTVHNPVNFIKVPLNSPISLPVGYLSNQGNTMLSILNAGFRPVTEIYIPI
jgi:hypothetical protein